MDESTDANSRDASSTPFDDFSSGQEKSSTHALHCGPLASTLRFFSGVALACALVGALTIVLADAVGWAHPHVSWKIKSAYPLMAIGISYALLQLTMPRSWAGFCLSMAVSAAFFLWGAEQFIPYPRITGLIDDFVVVLFVTDLGIVTRSHLRRAPRPKSASPDKK